MAMTTSPSTSHSQETPRASSVSATHQLAPLLTFPPGSPPVTAYITYAASPVDALIGWFHLPSPATGDANVGDDFAPELGPRRTHPPSTHIPIGDHGKWILHGQRAQSPPKVHACCAPKALLASSSLSCTTPHHDSCAASAPSNAGDDPSGPSFFDLLIRPPASWCAPSACGYLIRNVYKYPGDNLVLTRDYPDFVAREVGGAPPPAATNGGGRGITLEFDCATLHTYSGSEVDGGRNSGGGPVHEGLAALADKLGADWVCCEGRLVVEQVPLVAKVAPVVSQP